MSPRNPVPVGAGVLFSLFVLQGACAAPDPASVQPLPPGPDAAAAAVAESPADGVLANEPSAPSGQVRVAGLTGQEIAEQICGECHSMEPPPLKAPPLTPLSRHLRESFETVEGAVEHVLAYAPAPDAERSILPERAVERFGLMPPQPLPGPMLEAAARYIWSLSDSDAVPAQGPMRMRMRGGG